MDRVSQFVTTHRKAVIVAFLALAAVSGALSLSVPVNYNLVDYLPKAAQSTTAIRIMEEEFGGKMPNARVMIAGVTIRQALEYKQKLSAIDGVSSVMWLDDAIGADVLAATPIQFLDAKIVDAYYKHDSALFSLTVENGEEQHTVQAIYALIGGNNAADGEAVNKAMMQEMSLSEVLNAVAILLPVFILILTLSTTSWLEPLLYLGTIGVAVLINMGMNIFFGEISFVTRTVSPVLQLAVSLDYAIFLLHSFNDYRQRHEPQQAMRLAMKRALSAVAASAATTVIGFAALIFMRFGIGADLGLNLVKGVLLSFVCVMIFMPAITLSCHKAIDRWTHRPFIPNLRGAGKWLMKVRVPCMILAAVIAIPCLLAQSAVEFKYGMDDITLARSGEDAAAIERRFGAENTLALLVPRGDAGREAALGDALSQLLHVKSVVSYATAVGSEIPPQYVPKEAAEQFYSANYARLILYLNVPEEGAEAFAAVQEVLDTAAQHYETRYLAGQSATLYDMSNVVSYDTSFVNWLAIIGIAGVLLVTFKSLSLPLILLFTIETAIWINLSFAYFSGLSLNFIGYLVISTVQLGATVDYAILMTDNYMEDRKTLPKREAMRKTLGDNLLPVLVSGSTLSLAGVILAITSLNPIISELGILLGRGTALSFFMVVFVLPALLVLFDQVIQKTTLRTGFHKAGSDEKALIQ